MNPKNELLVKVGRSIRARRHYLKRSAEDVALSAGLDVGYLTGIERGERNVTILILCRIARELGVPVSELLSDIL